MTDYPRFHPVMVGRIIGIYDGRFTCWAIADREQANRTTGAKFDTREQAQAECDRLNKEN